MRSLSLILLAVASIASANLTTRLNPKEAMKLRKGEVCRYLRVSGGIPGRPLYQSLVIVRADRTVICKATDFESSFKMNKDQIDSWQSSMATFDPKHFDEGPLKTPNEYKNSKQGGTDHYLTVRKDGKIYASNSLTRRMGYVLIVDNLEVYFYLERPKDKDGNPLPAPNKNGG